MDEKTGTHHTDRRREDHAIARGRAVCLLLGALMLVSCGVREVSPTVGVATPGTTSIPLQPSEIIPTMTPIEQEHPFPAEVAWAMKKLGIESFGPRMAGTVEPTSTDGTVYYVDAVCGDDENDGKAETRAFRTIDIVQTLHLLPGDRVLFRRGCSFHGSLMIQSSGSPGKPIVIGAYGVGEKPRLTTASHETVISLIDQSHIRIENLNISAPRGAGIFVDCMNRTVLDIGIRGCMFVDIQRDDDQKREFQPENTPVQDKVAIRIGTWHEKRDRMTQYRSVHEIVVEQCEFLRVHNGIFVAGNIGDGSNVDYNRYPRTRGIRIIDCRFSDIVGEGTVFVGVEDAIVSHCLYERVSTGINPDDNANCIAPVWMAGSSRITIQYCEIAHCSNPGTNGDAMAIDFDWFVDHCTYQFNYSHANRHFMRPTPQTNLNNTVQFNISYQDGGKSSENSFGISVKMNPFDDPAIDYVWEKGLRIHGNVLILCDSIEVDGYDISVTDNFFIMRNTDVPIRYGRGVVIHENNVYANTSYRPTGPNHVADEDGWMSFSTLYLG